MGFEPLLEQKKSMVLLSYPFGYRDSFSAHYSHVPENLIENLIENSILTLNA